MGDHKLHLAIGIMGNAASLSLYAAPILTFARIIRKSSTEEYSCVPYILALSNCLFYTWYGLPLISYNWENFPLVTVNGIGAVLEISFVIIYLWFASLREKIKAVLMVIPVIIMFGTTAVISVLVFQDHHHRKMLVGCVGIVAAAGMYGSPLVAMRQVLRTKSVEFMPFYLSLFSFLASSLWLAYSLIAHDLLLGSPNFVGSPLGMVQLVLYFMYRKRGSSAKQEAANKWDQEKDEEKPKLLLIDESINVGKC